MSTYAFIEGRNGPLHFLNRPKAAESGERAGTEPKRGFE
jgi:hypothetical protein